MKPMTRRAALGAPALFALSASSLFAADNTAKKARAAAAPEATAAVDPGALRIGVDDSYPPFSSRDKRGKLTGFDIEIAQALCEQMKVKCNLIVMNDWAEVIPSIEAGRYDAVVASMSITDERLKKVAFTQKYYHVPAKFVARTGGQPIQSAADLAGKRLGVQAETTHADFLKAQLGGRATILEYATLGEALDDLVKGKLDLVMADSLALQVGFLDTPRGKGYSFIGPDFDDPRWFGPGTGIALPKANLGLRDRLNQAILDLRNNGKYQQISARYFPYDIYGQ